MKPTLPFLVLALIFFSVMGASGCGYNSLVRQEETVAAAWSEVENQLQRRSDLIPNYVEVVKGYARHEQEVFTKIAEARSKLAGAQSVEQKIEASNQLSSALSRLLLVVERYPELKANQNFIRLQDELAGTENRLAVARRRYNEAVKEYNTSLRSFPTLITAKIFRFEKKPYFEAPEASQAAPKVDFSPPATEPR